MYDKCVKEGIISQSIKHLFDKLETKNFEDVMHAIDMAKLVINTLGLTDKSIKCNLEKHYSQVREALIRAVEEVQSFSDPQSIKQKTYDGIFVRIKKCLLDFEVVYTTNYDLLIYWSIFADQDGKNQFKDFFWSSAAPIAPSLEGKAKLFDPYNVEAWGNATQILFLHGALHLMANSEGQCIKVQRSPCKNILGQLKEIINKETKWYPLFVAEGKSEHKERAILRNNYLNFAFNKFRDDDRDIVVLESSLSEADLHIVKSLMLGKRRRIFISYHSSLSSIRKNLDNAFKKIMKDKESLDSKYQIKNKIKNKKFILFPSHYHPLFRVKDEDCQL